MRWFLSFVFLAGAAAADVPQVVDQVILPGYANFTQATAALDKVAADCAPEALRPAFNAAFDAWIKVAHFRLGPSEESGRALAIAYWPDPKGTGARTIAAMVKAEDDSVDDAARFAQVSIAARGLFALERLLYAPDAPQGDYACRLRAAIAHDLARLGTELDHGWRDNFAQALLSPGQGGPYLDATEVKQALFTQLMTGLEFDKDQRIGRAIGTFERPRPERAEALLSGRSLQNLRLSLAALRDLARTLADAPKSIAAFDHAIATAADLPEDIFSRLNEPSERLKLEILGQQIAAVSEAALAEIAPKLGVGVGFNAADGD